MKLTSQLIAVIGTGVAIFSTNALAFSGDFEITNIVADSPSQANPSSAADSIVCFDFADQDTPEVAPTHCLVEWKVGLTPSSATTSSCDNTTFTVHIPEDAYKGVGNFTIDLSHSYIDNSVGEAPYNILTKFGSLNLTYPATPNYECDKSKAMCRSYEGKTMIALVTQAVA